MIEKYKKQIAQLYKEKQNREGKTLSPKRREYLIQQTRDIAKDLDNELGLRGSFESEIASIYDEGETAYPRMRLNKVIKKLMDEVGLEEEKKEK